MLHYIKFEILMQIWITMGRFTITLLEFRGWIKLFFLRLTQWKGWILIQFVDLFLLEHHSKALANMIDEVDLLDIKVPTHASRISLP